MMISGDYNIVQFIRLPEGEVTIDQHSMESTYDVESECNLTEFLRVKITC